MNNRFAIRTADCAAITRMALIHPFLPHPYERVQQLNNLTKPGGDVGFGLR